MKLINRDNMKLINIRTIPASLLLMLISTRQPGYLRLRGVAFSLLVVMLAFQVQPVAAATLQIQFTGLDIEYDGSSLTTVNGVDQLTTMTLLVDGSLVATLVNSSDIFANLSVDVGTILVGVGVVTPVTAGSFNLDLDAGSLELTLGDVYVNYLQMPAGFGLADVVLMSASASINNQNPLPYGLVIGDPVTLSFSTHVTSGSAATFTAAGTGEISGVHAPVPPAVWLFGSGLIGLASFAKRKKAKTKHLL